MRMEGGISAPIVPPAAIAPVANDGEYPALTISGTAMRPIAAAVASEEPQTAAKPEQAKIDEIAKAPGTRFNTDFAA